MPDSPSAGREDNLAAAPEAGTAILAQSEVGEWAIYPPEEALSEAVQQRLEVIQMLMAVKGTERYGQMQRRAAQKLGVSLRSVQRLMQAWQAEGLAGLTRRRRSDAGSVRVSEEWRQFIVKTYREGNRGSRRLSAAQVYIRVKVRAQELGEREYPSRPTVYRILKPSIEKRQRKRSLGWRGERLSLKTRAGLEISVEWSNQVWQADHTKVDVLVVDRTGAVLGRPWLSTVVDTYSRCIMGIHLGFDAPSAAVVCLALRHAILPKQYSGAYALKEVWGAYGLPQYLYTDGGKDFRSQHLEQVATELGIVLCLRRKPSDGGIVERPFGTFNREFFSGLPGYTGSNVTERSPAAESEACLTLQQLERLLVRYLVDNYNQAMDARMGDQSRIGRWEAGRIAQLPLLGERELDICLMRRDQRSVYRHGYIQFANLTYQGEHLAAYAGERVVVRYNPQDITTVLLYQVQESQEVFLTRAHAQGWETEVLSYAEARAISQRKRAAGEAISNRAMLAEVRDRDEAIKGLQRQKQKRRRDPPRGQSTGGELTESEPKTATSEVTAMSEGEVEAEEPKQSAPYVRVYDYEQLKREGGFL